MVEHSIHVGREDRIIVFIHHHCRSGPPQEGLRKRRTVIDLRLDFDVCFSRIERETCHTLGAEHAFHFAAPYSLTAIGELLNHAVGRQEGAGAMVLRPVELNTSGNPRAGQPYQRRFNDLIVIYKMTFFHLVVCHLDASAQFRENHQLDIFIFEKESPPWTVVLLVFNLLYDRIRIHRTGTSLINPFLEKNRVLFLFTNAVGRQHDGFFPRSHLGSMYRTLNQIFCYFFHDRLIMS